MPCRDYYDDHPEAYFRDVTEPALKKQVSFAESALCQTLAAFAKFLNETSSEVGGKIDVNPLNYIDYKEAGIDKRDLAKWWKDHQILDAKHREEERLRNLRARALSKLSAEEKKALGVK